MQHTTILKGDGNHTNFDTDIIVVTESLQLPSRIILALLSRKTGFYLIKWSIS